ncbi:PadR family transcriptional regulator [Kineococcus rubinsiae]|uniref:PadR family transcriptional regulator n=1 Tax=Kineococcus rubinsiae TaxID=2609562 RepID=UPI00142FC68B|nr:PadR family transcriptional regulator [Kineococcus rubinsiae]NIZ90317.1 PadR family transcriptional regulator [Kineococcus rubinsiae]
MIVGPGTAADGERRAQLLRGSLDLCVLAALDQQPSHAYELATRLAEAGLGEVSYGTVYPLITRLRRSGLLHEQQQLSPLGPARKVFSLTKAGRAALTDWLALWQRSTSDVEAVLRATGVWAGERR